MPTGDEEHSGREVEKGQEEVEDQQPMKQTEDAMEATHPVDPQVRSEQDIVSKYTENKTKKTLRHRMQSQLRGSRNSIPQEVLRTETEDPSSLLFKVNKEEEQGGQGQQSQRQGEPPSSADQSCVDRGKSFVKKNMNCSDHWLLHYDYRKNLGRDISTGLLLGVVLIPQGLSYGLLAELPAYYGLYAALTAPVIYSIFGTSNELSIGPFALISILLADTIGDVVPFSSDDYIEAVMTTSFLTGCILMFLWLFRLGQIVNFLSSPVLTALTTAGSFLIATSQMKHFLGVDFRTGSNFFTSWFYIFSSLGEVNPATVVIGIVNLFIQAGVLMINSRVEALKKRNIQIPGALVCVVLSIVFIHFSKYDERFDVLVLGPVPNGLPTPSIPGMLNKSTDLLSPAFVIAIVGFSLSFATAKSLADKKDDPTYSIAPNQELLAHGMANLVGCFFLSYPCFASLSRSAIAFSGEVRTPAHNLVSPLFVVIVLLFFTQAPILDPLPFATLSAVILFSLRSVFKQVFEVPKLFRTDFNDFLVWMITFIAVLGIDIAIGLGVGVVFSFTVLLRSISSPPFSTLGQLPFDKEHFKDIKRIPQASELSGILIVRFDSSLNFANKASFEKRIRTAISKRLGGKRRDSSPEQPKVAGGEEGRKLQYVILEAGSIVQVDSSGIKAMQILVADLNQRGLQLIVCNAKWRLRDALEKADITVPRFLTVGEAVKYVEKLMLSSMKTDSVESIQEETSSEQKAVQEVKATEQSSKLLPV